MNLFFSHLTPTVQLKRYLLSVSGTGTFGQVLLCQEKSTSKFYAMKILAIADVIRLKQVEHVKNEKNVLLEIKHPFLVTLWVSSLQLCGNFREPPRLRLMLEQCCPDLFDIFWLEPSSPCAQPRVHRRRRHSRPLDHRLRVEVIRKCRPAVSARLHNTDSDSLPAYFARFSSVRPSSTSIICHNFRSCRSTFTWYVVVGEWREV